MPRRYANSAPATGRPPRHRRGFTLVELLVVLFIIALLAAILIPVVGKVRSQGYRTDTAAQINAIRTAIEAYHSNFRAYPGPFSDNDVYGQQNWNVGNRSGIPSRINDGGTRYVTGAEQLVLSLCGGLKLEGPNVTWDQRHYPKISDQPPEYTLPAGPMNLNPANPKTYSPFLENASRFIKSDFAVRTAFMDAAGRSADDTALPEFLDRYPTDALPILYMRARVGAPGVIGTPGNPPYQYDLRQIVGYTGKLDPRHGLKEIGTETDIKKSMNANGGGSDAYAYFLSAGVSGGATAANQVGAAPRSKDSYILISAGPDRIYGTLDDITSFGSFD